MFFAGIMDFIKSDGTVTSPRRRPIAATPKPPTKTVCGAGTCGVGPGKSNTDTVAKAAFREWMDRKRQAGALSPRSRSTEPSAASRARTYKKNAAPAQAREALVEAHRTMAQDAQQESKKIAKLIERREQRRLESVRERAKDLNLLGAMGKEEHSRREAERAEEMAMIREEIHDEQQEWRDMLTEEKQSRLHRIQEYKAAERQHHSRALAAIEEAKKARLEQVLEAKRRDEQRMEKWRAVQDNEQRAVCKNTQNFRQHVRKANKESKEKSRESVAELVRKQRDEEAAIKARLQQKKIDREEAQRAEIARIKAVQETAFAERIAELREKNRESALETKWLAEEMRLEREEEQRQRQDELIERRRDLQRSRQRSRTPRAGGEFGAS